MNLTLLVPNLFWPDISQPEIYNDLSTPYLEKLLSKSTSAHDSSHEMEAWLCKAFNVEKVLSMISFLCATTTTSINVLVDTATSK